MMVHRAAPRVRPMEHRRGRPGARQVHRGGVSCGQANQMCRGRRAFGVCACVQSTHPTVCACVQARTLQCAGTCGGEAAIFAASFRACGARRSYGRTGQWGRESLISARSSN